MTQGASDRRSGVSRGQFLRRVGGGVATIAVAGTALPDVVLGAVTPPTGLTAIAFDSKVVLAWQPAAGASGGYTVLRGPGAGAPTTVVSGAGGVSGTTFTDTSANNGSIYSYAVRANSGGSQSANSNLVNAAPIPLGSGSGNAIVQENSVPGHDRLEDAERAAGATGIEGFATATSINAGDSVDLKVNTADDVPFHVEIYRTGYYGGTNGRLISTLPGLTVEQQDYPPVRRPTRSARLLHLEHGTRRSRRRRTGRAAVYLLRLVRDDNGDDNHILLVVRHDGDNAAVLYGVPTATYQAYNNYGGKSLYDLQLYRRRHGRGHHAGGLGVLRPALTTVASTA